ncbi:MAG: thiol-activated cytolysin family protein, partial [Bacillota bacterium]|nr:thiol-activated cytolysin family protein [Bacillota bacterium]
MKKRNIKTRIVAAIMAAISVFSATAMLTTSVSAAELDTPAITTVSERDSLRDYIYNEIDYSKVNLTKRMESQQNYTLYNLEDGTLTVAYPKENSIDKTTEDFSAMNQIKSIVYPGSLIKINQQFVNGTPTKINAERNAMKFSIDCGEGCTFEVVPQTEGDVLKAIYKVMEETNRDVPAQATLQYAKASSESQLQAELGMSAKALKGLNIDFKAINECKQTTYVMKYHQIYYTVTAELPQNAEDVFADTVTKDVLVRNKVDSQNIPAYVSSVSYGREVYVVVTSATSKTSVNAAEKLEASKFSFNSKQEWSSVLENCNVSIYMLGGASENITSILNIRDFESFLDAIAKETKFTSATCAYPLSYTANYLTTNEKVATKLTGEYVELVYDTRTSTPVEFKMRDMRWPIDSAKITITGKYITGINEKGEYIHGNTYTKVYNFEDSNVT